MAVAIFAVMVREPDDDMTDVGHVFKSMKLTQRASNAQIMMAIAGLCDSVKEVKGTR